MSLPIVSNPDREQFEAWFLSAFPRPRSKAQHSQWKHRQNMAWRGWMAARRIPESPKPQPSLTRAFFQEITPEMIRDMSEPRAGGLSSRQWREAYQRAGLHPCDR